MYNDDVAEIFYELSEMEEIEGKKWESLAYRKIANNISALGEDIREVYKRGELRKIDGVGPAIEKKIIQYIEQGKIDLYERLREKYPVDFKQMRRIQGLGPKKISLLYTKLGIKNVDDLKKAIDLHRVADLTGFGGKSEEKLQKSLSVFLSSGPSRIPLATAYRDIMAMLEYLIKSDSFGKIEVAGSIRRMKETIGDVDIISATSDREKAGDFFVNSDFVSGIVVKGESKITVNLKIGITCDLRFTNKESYGACLQYFTGSKDHNVHLRDLALTKGMKLNEYGLFKGDMKIAGETEESVYKALGLEYIEPELRENTGEIEASLSGHLPKLVQYSDVKGDLHVHSSDSDGMNTVEEMLRAAEKNELEYIALTNHSENLKVANGLDEKRFADLNEKIDALSSKSTVKILKGVELEILKDGSLDLSQSTLDNMDFVLASLHQHVSSSREENTLRIINAIRSGKINAIAHPTGRIIGSREPYSIDLDSVVRECVDNNVMLEINGSPERSDLPFDLVKRFRDSGIMFSLGSDAHNTSDLFNLRFATAIARRGWLDGGKIANTLSLKELLKVLKR